MIIIKNMHHKYYNKNTCLYCNIYFKFIFTSVWRRLHERRCQKTLHRSTILKFQSVRVTWPADKCKWTLMDFYTGQSLQTLECRKDQCLHLEFLIYILKTCTGLLIHFADGTTFYWNRYTMLKTLCAETALILLTYAGK